MDDTIALVVYSISSVDYTVQTLKFVVRKFGQYFVYDQKKVLYTTPNRHGAMSPSVVTGQFLDVFLPGVPKDSPAGGKTYWSFRRYIFTHAIFELVV